MANDPVRTLTKAEKAKLRKMAKDSTQVVIGSGGIERLQGLGLKMTKVKTPSLDALFRQKKNKAKEVIAKLPPRPYFGRPEVEELYGEIFQCVLFGLNGAAITLCGILVEYALKLTIYSYWTNHSQAYEKELWEKLEWLSLEKAIREARRLGFLPEENALLLERFKDEVRNPYNHFNIKKITKGTIAGRVQHFNLDTGFHEEIDIAAEDSPMIQAQVKPHVEERNVFTVVQGADNFVRQLLSHVGYEIKFGEWVLPSE